MDEKDPSGARSRRIPTSVLVRPATSAGARGLPSHQGMRYRDHRAPVWVIWGLIALFGVIEAVAWIFAGGIPRRPGALAQIVTAWIVMIILAVLATRRIGSMAQRIQAHEHTHLETLGELEQLQTQNAMLE